MKITKQLSLLLVVLMTAFSCDELDELTEFDISDDFSTTVTIDVPENEGGMSDSFSYSEVIDIATNQQISDNLNLIQNIRLNSLTYEISNFTGAEGETVTEASLNLGSTSISVENINLKASDDGNIVYDIEDTSLLNAIANALESNTALTVSVTGTVNATPVTFDVIINIDVTVTVDVL